MLKKTVLTALLTSTFAVLASQYSLGQQRNPNAPIRANDRDGDGRLSPAEWPRKNFSVLDKNRDGFLTPDEFARQWGIPLPSAGPRKAGSSNANAAADTPEQETVLWIDTHVHATGGGRRSAADYRETMEEARAAIGDHGFARAVLMPTPQLHPSKFGYYTVEGFAEMANQYPDHFAFLGGGGSLNPMINEEAPNGKVSAALRKRFQERAVEILALGAVGFGEMTALHFSLTENHPYERVAADHPLFLDLADIAAQYDVPIDFHMEPVVSEIPIPDYLKGRDNPDNVSPNIDGFERLLEHNRGAKIVWAHAGTALLPHRTTTLTQKLMDRHPNLYLQIGVLPGKVPELRIMGKDGVRPEWLPLIRKYSDRIVLGGDQFYSPANNIGPAAKFSQAAVMVRERFQKFLASLPPELSRKIAYENAIRIYKLDRWK